MGNTVTISSCVPVIRLLCSLIQISNLIQIGRAKVVEIASSDGELRDKVCEIIVTKYGNKYCTLDLLRSSCGTIRFRYCYSPTISLNIILSHSKWNSQIFFTTS